ncbi:HNH endonuclease [Arthrobacter zhangbolii]|uniref:HNH endonuclease n=1 Tax=Arthrobacter zhangbolii TaxID=2886936 RepID=A0A9X1S929_9MICC|nr:HNH endonuclease signature motif containing protein [Arthrobacter zhangbolii]MCC3273265.1 HNH endonuclease [Arthrobacter zhangbolii]UON92752.1 HNH endonuclease [Arthrobacter zhangbolii]
MTNTTTIVPPGFKLSKSIRDELPPSERASARESLWQKSRGRCSLCNEPLAVDGTATDVDHVKARKEGNEGEGGVTELKNLYLAHKSCNRSRKNLSYPLAATVIRFGRWSTAHPRRSFGDVINHYIENGNQRVVVSLSDTTATLTFGSIERSAPIYEDPATRTKYFFMNVPIEYIQNDEGTQPRFIEHDHVRTLAIDFSDRPVHEPSNCRLVSCDNGLADLKQFDGQHKTTAQILLKRTEIPMKMYVDPDPAMINNLVVQIQQGIKKRPLSTTDTLQKLDKVMQDKVAAYKAKHDGKSPSESELVSDQPLQDQAKFKKQLLANFEWAILNHENLELKKQKLFSTKLDKKFPLTDRVLVTKIIRPLVCQELLDEPLDNSIARENEREAIVQLLNRVTDNMLTDKWRPQPQGVEEDIMTLQARAFFMQGAIAWWLKSIFIPALQGQFLKQKWKRLFLEPLSEVQQERLDGYIDLICGWDVWSTTDETHLAAWRSNTVTAVEKAFPEYSNVSLVNQFAGT